MNLSVTGWTAKTKAFGVSGTCSRNEPRLGQEGITPAHYEHSDMKWKNIDAGACYYYITATFTEWLPLLNNTEVRRIVCEEISKSLNECGAKISAFVLMPDHLHLLVYLPASGLLHSFLRSWRGRSAQRVIKYAQGRGAGKILTVMERHANGKSHYTVWKEQSRALAIWNEKKLHAMINYIHANPVRRELVTHPGQWESSSWRFYETGEAVEFDIERVEL